MEIPSLDGWRKTQLAERKTLLLKGNKMESDEEPWGFRDDESPPRYQPETEDLTDEESYTKQRKLDVSEGFSCFSKKAKKSNTTYVCDACLFITDDFMNFITHKNEHSNNKDKKKSLFTCGNS
ncbi:hypothetical protein EB796_006684 [Bugula neritina]|uniref:Uncharacterized protein n=1 Tax=Bugula neritina TaxID=10212 RepID=A0A7J7K8P9_BUGNE|nr:hypothetical protein EB796_006684 [Bugula neritina]